MPLLIDSVSYTAPWTVHAVASSVKHLVDSVTAKIDKLSILGVRSFDNTRGETIQFHTPLTLIVGFNGSGKTTIIECLKYATTGDLPPNSKGGAFIHDPKLCGEKEVLAQVKLSFKGTSGARMVATRSLQLTVRKATRQFKTLEGQLLMVKDGERTAISSRVAELDQIMPQYLGVSKAVLDSVIFCHQDESLWPMSEPSVLKKKFDEIFEALKYTKAVDNIKALRKKQNEELAKHKIMEQHAKEDKDKGDRAEKRSRELSNEIENLRAETKQLGTEVTQISAKAEEAWKQVAHYDHIVAKLNGKRIEARALKKNMEGFREHIKEMSESDEWLQSTLDQYEERTALHIRHKEGQTKKYEELKQEINRNREQLESKHTEAGKYQAEKDSFEKQVERREQMIKEMARSHNIRGFDIELDDMQINDFVEKIAKMAKDQNLSLERLRRETAEELEKAQGVLSQLEQQKLVLTEGKNSARQQITSNDRKADELETQLDSIRIDEGSKAALESAKEHVEDRLGKAKADYEDSSWDHKIEEVNSQIQSLERQGMQLNGELIQGTKKAGDSARLDFLKKEMKDRQRSLDTMIGAYGERIRAAVGDKSQPSSLDRDLQAALDVRRGEMIQAEQQRDGISREIEQADFKMNTARADLKRKRNEMQACEKHIRDAIDDEPSEYPDALAVCQNNRDVTRQDADNFTNMSKYYENCLKYLEGRDACLLCSRHFRDGKERSTFRSTLEKLISKAAKDALAADLETYESELKKAREAGPSYDTWLRLSKDEIPSLEADVKRLQGQRQELLDQVEELEKDVTKRSEIRKDVETLAKTVANITKYSGDISNYQNQIHDLAAKQTDSGSSRSLEDVQEELDRLNERSRTAKSSAARLVSDRDRAKAEINSLELESRDVMSKLTDATHQLQDKINLLARIEEYRTNNRHLRESMKRSDDDIQDLIPQISEAQNERNEIRQRGASKEKEMSQKASKLADSVYQLKQADQAIGAYIEKGGPNQLARCQREIANLQQEIQRLEEEQKQIVVEINKINEQLKNNDDNKRNIADNIRYRQDARNYESVKVEIDNLEAQNAEADIEICKTKAKQLDSRYKMLNAEQASKMGAMKSKDDQLMQLLNDWNTDYKDAGLKYKEAHIKVETSKAAVEDLGRYGGALDKYVFKSAASQRQMLTVLNRAIMKYHSIKMEEINRIIEELWKKTYQGTDVDTVLIRTEHETGKANKSYNYRVCMVKQDVEMDMRGRCSAGQRVLACIIIRLALAECFGVNCGLIALDEPTTNLDRDNIQSLAESLHDIIKTRQQQSNFQLIVITHDEDFLRYMQCADFCDNYYRVSRNERQKSIIERQSIAAVM